MSGRSQAAGRTHSPATVKTEPGSPKTGHQAGGGGGSADEGSGPAGVKTTPPVQNGFHGSGSDSDSGVDAPLDFSMKSRNRISDGGSDGDSKDGLEPLKPEPMDCSNNPCTSPSSEGKPCADTGDGSSNGEGEAGRNGLSRMIGEPPTAFPGGLPGAVGAAMPGLIPNAGLFANLPMYMDPRRMQQVQSQAPTGNKSTARPFKAYPKDPLSLPLGFYGIPGMLPFPSIDTVTAQAMNMSSEEVFNQYRSYVMRLQQEQVKNSKDAKTPLPQAEHQKQLELLKQQIELHQKQQLHPHLQQQQKEHIREQLREHQQQQQQQGLPSQPSPSGKSSISETSTTARSNSSSPNTTCTTPIPTSPNGAQTAAGPTTGTGNGEATTSNTSPGSGPGDESEGMAGSTTPNRKRGRTLPDEQKDEAYWERRRKNNEAAKRSRDSRRAKEDEIAIRAAFLEQENLKLRVEVAALKNETAKLRCMLYNS